MGCLRQRQALEVEPLMAIVLKYGAPGPVILAGYAAGVGHAQREQKRDALRLWQQQQAQNFQGQQSALDRQQRAELQQAAFAQQSGLAEMERTFRAEQQQGIQGFQAEQDELRRKFASGEAEKERAARSAEYRKHEEFTQDRDILGGLRRGELELPPSAQQRLKELDDSLAYAMTLDDAQEQEARQKIEKEKQSLYRLAQPRQYSPATEFNLGTVYVDQGGKGYDEPGEGRIPLNARTGRPVFEQKETVPFQGENVDLATYSDYRKSVEKELSDYDKRFDKEDPTTDEQKKEFISKYGERPVVPPTVYELRHPKQEAAPQQQPFQAGTVRNNRGPDGKPMVGGQEPTSLLTPEDIAAINAGGGMHDDLVYKTGPGGQRITGSTDLSGNFVPSEVRLDKATLNMSRNFMPTIENDKQLQAANLKPGDVFIGPDGQVHRVPDERKRKAVAPTSAYQGLHRTID